MAGTSPAMTTRAAVNFIRSPLSPVEPSFQAESTAYCQRYATGVGR
jgi:hypothetical protein